MCSVWYLLFLKKGKVNYGVLAIGIVAICLVASFVGFYRMKNVVIVGAGKEGKGTFGDIFYENKWNITFIDKDENVINSLNEKNSYIVEALYENYNENILLIIIMHILLMITLIVMNLSLMLMLSFWHYILKI